jgi:hypothetical protein
MTPSQSDARRERDPLVRLSYALIARQVLLGPQTWWRRFGFRLGGIDLPVGSFHAMTAVNILDALQPSGFPVKVPLLVVLARLNAPSSAGRDHKYAIRIVDDDGNEFGGSPERIIALEAPAPGFELYSTQVNGAPNVVFPQPGRYTFEIHVDGHRLGGPTLDVLDAKTALVPRRK